MSGFRARAGGADLSQTEVLAESTAPLLSAPSFGLQSQVAAISELPTTQLTQVAPPQRFLQTPPLPKCGSTQATFSGFTYKWPVLVHAADFPKNLSKVHKIKTSSICPQHAPYLCGAAPSLALEVAGFSLQLISRSISKPSVVAIHRLLAGACQVALGRSQAAAEVGLWQGPSQKALVCMPMAGFSMSWSTTQGHI